MATETEKPDRTMRTLWIGAAGAGLATLAGMFGFHDGSVWRMPQALERQVKLSLQAAGFSGVDVEMRGQRAVLRGIVENDEARAAAERAALQAAGHGGPWSGGVTGVDASGVTVGAFERPFFWSAQRDGVRIVLSGAAPSETARADLVAVATAKFPNLEAVDAMHVAGGAPSVSFTDVAREMLRDLGRLRSGEARIIGDRVVLIGDGSFETVSQLQRAYEVQPAPFKGRVVATVDGLDLARPDLQGLNLRNPDAATCTQAFERMLEGVAIQFTRTGGIDAASIPVLEALAGVALRCDRHAIIVMAPGAGGAEQSRSRAQAVVSYFASQGVLRSSLHGEAGAGARMEVLVTDAQQEPG